MEVAKIVIGFSVEKSSQVEASVQTGAVLEKEEDLEDVLPGTETEVYYPESESPEDPEPPRDWEYIFKEDVWTGVLVQLGGERENPSKPC